MKPIRIFKYNILALPHGSNERSYYKLFQEFLESYLGDNISTIAEETAADKIGYPDITLRQNNNILGWIEVKKPDEDLSNKNFITQFNKYKDSLENIIFTNFRQWQLWQWNDGKPLKADEITCDIQNYTPQSEKNLYKLLQKFMDGHATDAHTPAQLAQALARKAKFLSQQVEENFNEDDEKSELYQLKKAFSQTLIQNINKHQFANMIAETLAYSLFLAALEYSAANSKDNFTLENVTKFLPKNVPILIDLYELISKVSKRIKPIQHTTQLIINQLQTADLDAILSELNKHKQGEDPVIHFYEPFLRAYVPEERKARGVYYTPKPVVDFIVNSVDYLLENRFNKDGGLTNSDVNILDPAAGTGTFLMSAVQKVWDKTNKAYSGTGIEKREFQNIVEHHILKNFYGFELMVAPYAIAHLKLTLELKRLGFNFIDDDARLQIYLANTLDDPNLPPPKLIGFDSIPEESESAREIKKDRPILAIIGNPPYAAISQNPVEKIIYKIVNDKEKKIKLKTWIGELIEDYKQTDKGHFNEKKHWLGDDYVKFLRFAQWKINQTGHGIVAMITNNGFLDNVTFRGMRYQLMQTFDEIYCLNLHGNSIKKEAAPDGGKDENIFNIRVGAGITFFIKTTNKKDCKVFYKDVHGLQKEKYEYLDSRVFEKMEWEELKPATPHFFFINKNLGLSKEYEKGWKINDIFRNHVTGIVSMGDNFIIEENQDKLKNKLQKFLTEDTTEEKLKQDFNLGENYPRWILNNKPKIKIDTKKFTLMAYRPFDHRWTYFDNKLIWRWREEVMQHFLTKDNLGIIFARNFPSENTPPVFCSKNITNFRYWSRAGMQGGDYLSPLYLYPEGELTTEREPNLNPEFIKDITEKLGEKPTPENIFYYAYAVFHCPSYRKRYSEFLKIDFPRLPITNNKKLFDELSKHGKTLVNLHLLGKNPFDKSKTIFEYPTQWQVKINDKCENWQIEKVEYAADKKRVYINKEAYFEGIDETTWQFMIGGYQPLDKWLKDRKKAGINLSNEDIKHYIKIAVSLRETKKETQKINKLIPQWDKF